MGKIRVLFRWTAAILLYLAAIRYSVLAQGQAGTVTALLHDAKLSAKQAQEICRQEAEQENANYLCFWGEQPDIVAECRDTGKSSTVNMVLAQGSYELVMEGAGALAWEENGCLIDTATAAKLFGTEQADGQKLWCNDRESTVCGTFTSLRPMLIRRAEAGDGDILGMVSAAGGRQESSGTGNPLTSEAMAQLLMRYGLAGDVVSFLFLCDFVHTLLLILPLLCAFRLLVILWRAVSTGSTSGIGQSCELIGNMSGIGQPRASSCNMSGIGQSSGSTGSTSGTEQFQALSGNTSNTEQFSASTGSPSGVKQSRESTGVVISRRIILFAFGAIILAASCYLVRKEFRIPADMIPTRWSDFSFWAAWWETQRRNLLLILGSAQGEAQLMTVWNLLVSLFCNLLSIITAR